MESHVDQLARDAAAAAQKSVDIHEAECIVRYERLSEGINRLESILKWAGTVVITCMVSILGWSLMQMLSTNDAQRKSMAAQVEMLKEADRVRAIQAADKSAPARLESVK